ncbi:MAG: 50S ribosomal protein L25 [bacterium]|nr:50S ribosomal protein L25 [bacterium]
MKALTLQASKRDVTGKKVASLREEGLVPAVIYGRGIQNASISVPYNTFEKVYREAGESSLVDLVVENGQPVKVLIQSIDANPLTGRLIHADFFQVNMKEKLTLSIPLKFVGEPKAVKELGGILVKAVDEIEVRCLPDKLVSEIEVDVSGLATFEDAITMGDVILPEGMELHQNINDIVATVTQPISEEELKALEEKPVEDVSQVKVEEKKKAVEE